MNLRIFVKKMRQERYAATPAAPDIILDAAGLPKKQSFNRFLQPKFIITASASACAVILVLTVVLRH